MIALIDYGVGNLFSLESSFKAVGEEAVVTNDASVIRASEKIILPGVGAFEDAARKLRESGMEKIILEETEKGKPLLGICLGMQLLFSESYEFGCHKGLGLINGTVRPISDVVPKNYKIPQIGWNALHFKKKSPLFENVNEGDHVYFVHSYYAAECDDAVIATTEYGAELTAAVSSGNVFGCQFHPEKSGKVGLSILSSFCKMKGETLC